jgi:hypothetical protein
LTALRTLCEYFLEGRSWSHYCDGDELEDIKRGVTSIIMVLERQKLHKTINAKQTEFLEMYNEIEKLLHETRLVVKNEDKPFELWDFLEQNSNNLADISQGIEMV